MKRIFCLCLVVACCLSAFSVPARPGRIPVVMGNDTVYISLKGDECCKYATDTEGYTLLQLDKEWRYAEVDKDGFATPSRYGLVAEREKTPELRQFLKTQQKGIRPFVRPKTNMRTKNMNVSNKANTPVVGKRRVLVILMQFPDWEFVRSADDFQRLFNETGFREDGAMGSVRDYYNYVSHGRLDLLSDIKGPYTASQRMAYYGGNTSYGGADRNPYALFEEAVESVAMDVNLADYDVDKDGYVDNIHIIYAGYGEEAGASSDAIWAHEMTFREITVQGVKINKYSCAPELRGNMGNGISRIGPHCHEIGHALGAMDYYDTNYEEDGHYPGCGVWDVMASGSWNNDGISPANFNPYVRIYDFGWEETVSLQMDAENEIRPSCEKGNIYRLDTGADGDFYLLENRQRVSFDEALPGEGLLIFHIGPGIEEEQYANTVNSAYPQLCYPVCASSDFPYPTFQPQSYGNIDNAGCPFPGSSGKNEFSDHSVPKAATLIGEDTGICLTDIKEENGSITLYCKNGNSVQPGEPDEPEPEEPEEDGDIAWHEDFEDLDLSGFWEYEDVVETGTFNVRIKLMGEDTPSSPVAANGHGYALFTQQQDEQEPFQERRAHGKVRSGDILLDKDAQYELSFKFRKYAMSEKSCDSLSVCVMTKQAEGCTQEYAMEVQSQTKWEVFSTLLPNGTEKGNIAFDFNITNGSVLFLDDIRITAVDNASNIKPTCPDVSSDHRHSMPIGIYDLQGRKADLNTPGIKIVQMKGGMAKKIIVHQR